MNFEFWLKNTKIVILGLLDFCNILGVYGKSGVICRRPEDGKIRIFTSL